MALYRRWLLGHYHRTAGLSRKQRMHIIQEALVALTPATYTSRYSQGNLVYDTGRVMSPSQDIQGLEYARTDALQDWCSFCQWRNLHPPPSSLPCPCKFEHSKVAHLQMRGFSRLLHPRGVDPGDSKMKTHVVLLEQQAVQATCTCGR
jgi:hypothetical protein